MKMTKCTNCRASARTFRRGSREQRYQVGATTYRTSVPMDQCPKCREGFIKGPDLHHAELGVAAEVARRGPASGETFRFMRKILGVRGNEMAELLGVRPETVSRWEQGKGDVDRAAWALVAGLAMEAAEGRSVLRDRLEALRKPVRAAKDVRV